MSSSRRANGEISILAMLDGQSRRSLSRRFPAMPALLGYAAAGTAACVLVGVLAWLAHEGMDGPSGRNAAVIAEAAMASSASVAGAPTASTPADTADDIAVDGGASHTHAQADAQADAHVPAPAAGRAAIVDALAADTPAASSPSLPSGAPPTSAAGTAATTAMATATTAPATSATSPKPAATPAMVPGSPAPTASARNTAGKAVAARPAHARPAQLAAQTTNQAGARSEGRADTRNATAPRAKRGPPPPRPAQATPDMDVALITAIIQHAGRPSAAGVDPADAPCVGKSCGPRMPEQP